MKLGEFSGYRSWLILQDIYSTVWMYNVTMLEMIHINEKDEIICERYKYEMKRNVNIAIGVIKSYIVRYLISEDKKETEHMMDNAFHLIKKHLIPVRPKRVNPRSNKYSLKTTYKYSY